MLAVVFVITKLQSHFIPETFIICSRNTNLCISTFDSTYGQQFAVLKYSSFCALLFPVRLPSELGHRPCLMSTQAPTEAREGTESGLGLRKIGRSEDSGQFEGTRNSGQLLSYGNVGPVLPGLSLFKRCQKSRF